MFDNTALIACISHLLEVLESQESRKKSQKPLNLTLSHQKFNEARTEMKGTGFRPYGADCNEDNHYEGRTILLRNGQRKNHCLVGAVTAFRVMPLGQSQPDAQKKYLNIKSRKHIGQMKYNEQTLVAEIDYELQDCTEYRMLSGALVPMAGKGVR